MRRIAALLIVAGCWTNPPPPPPLTPAAPAAAPAPKPPVVVECRENCRPSIALVDTTGRSFGPTSLAGKIVLVDFFATWAHPSDREIQVMSRVFDAYNARGVVVLGVMIDQPDDATLAEYVRLRAISYPIIRSTPDIIAAYGYVNAVPTSLLFDRNGDKVASHVGLTDEAFLKALIDRLVVTR